MTKLKIPICILLVMFGWSSWIDLNGLWVELPLLVDRLPEGWSLPAYFTIIIQLANVGPLLYSLLVRWIGQKYGSERLETSAIFIVISVGAVAVLLLAFFWHHTSFIGSSNHSTVLLCLAFFLALVDCTSSVTFLPFMSRLRSGYMTAFYIGEGMSGLLPAAMAFIQGAGEYTCVNSTVNGTVQLVPQDRDLLFDVQDFFICLFVMLMMSAVAFSLLKYLPYCQREASREPVCMPSDLESTASLSSSETTKLSSKASIVHKEELDKTCCHCSDISVLLIMAYISALGNGVLPSIQIYSLLPYGHIYYSLAVKLSALANPLACFLAFCVLPKRKWVIWSLVFASSACAAYILAIASHSPVPPSRETAVAGIMVLVWVMWTALTSYLKTVIAHQLFSRGHRFLFWQGVSAQAGSFVGAVISFLCVTVFGLLHAAPACAQH